MIQFDECVRLRLSDTALLKESFVALPIHKTTEITRHFLQDLKQRCSNQVWLIIRPRVNDPSDPSYGDYKAEEIIGLMGLEPIDEKARRMRLHLFCLPEGPDDLLLATVVHQAMNRENVFRLETELLDQDKRWSALQADWHLEGTLRQAHYNDKTSLHNDVYFYALLRPEQPFISVSFVPFNKAVIALVADEAGLLETDFIRYGEPVANQRIRELAAWFCLLDENGRLLNRSDLKERFGDQEYLCLSKAPDILKKASEQVVAYFRRQLKNFDVPLHLEKAGPFQRQVWEALTQIPFGVTRTYEEIAYDICGNQEEARKMARAVGSACRANPFPLILPCHRVIGKDGRLVGFRVGLDIKEYLLTYEMMGID